MKNSRLQVRIGEVCRISNGFAFDSDQFVTHGGFPLIRIRDLKTNMPSLGFSGDFDEAYVVSSGALLVGMDGEFKCYEWQGPPALLNQRVCELVPNPIYLDRDFLRFWISQELLRIEEETAFTTVKHLSSRDIQALPIDLPSLLEQKLQATRLRSQLAEIFVGGAALKEQIHLADVLPARILDEAFSWRRPINSQRSTIKPIEEWSWMRLLDLARLESGHTPSRRRPEWWGGHVPWLALPDIRKLHGKYAYDTSECTNDAGLANSSARLLPPSTVCVSRTASIGFVTILGKSMATSQDFCNWICGPNLDPDFLMYAFMASQDYLRELGSGAVHKTIYMPTIESFHICAPDIQEQRRIARMLGERLGAAETLTEGLYSRLGEIERLPQRLLAAAFDQRG